MILDTTSISAHSSQSMPKILARHPVNKTVHHLQGTIINTMFNGNYYSTMLFQQLVKIVNCAN